MEKPEDIVKHLRDLVKQLGGDDFSLHSKKYFVNEIMRYRKVQNRLEDCLILLKNDSCFRD